MLEINHLKELPTMPRQKSFKGHAVKGGAPRHMRTGAQGTRFADRNLLGVSPNKTQFEPTDAEPVNAHKQMAGTA